MFQYVIKPFSWEEILWTTHHHIRTRASELQLTISPGSEGPAVRSRLYEGVIVKTSRCPSQYRYVHHHYTNKWSTSLMPFCPHPDTKLTVTRYQERRLITFCGGVPGDGAQKDHVRRFNLWTCRQWAGKKTEHTRDVSLSPPHII